MADIRIKDLATTATTTASDDFMAVDGATNGTRKLSAATPAFLTSVTTPSLTSPASTPLTLGTGSFGTALTVASATGAATFAGAVTVSGTQINIQSGGATDTLRQGNAIVVERTSASGNVSLAPASSATSIGGTVTMSAGAAVGGATAGAGGLAFPATAVAVADANTLDDYEEGTWTGTLTPLTSGTITLSAATCSYTKVGRLVTINGQINTSAVSAPVGRLRVGGLPFTVASGVQFESRALITVNGAIAIIAIDSWIANGGSFIDIYPTGTTTDTYASNINASTSLIISGTFFV